MLACAYTDVACCRSDSLQMSSPSHLAMALNNILDTSFALDRQSSTPSFRPTHLVATPSTYVLLTAHVPLTPADSAVTVVPTVKSPQSTAVLQPPQHLADNTAEFGAFVSDGTAATGGAGANTAVARWDGTGSTYLMDTTTASDNVLSTYGSKIAETSGGDPKQANSVNNTISFAAVASPVTPAGIYSENFSLIGVGTF